MNRILTSILFIIFIQGCSYMPGKTTVDKKPPVTQKIPANYQSAVSAAKQGDIEQAIIRFNDIIKTSPEFSPAYTNLGLQYLKNKQLKDAETTLKKAIELNSNDAVAYNHVAIIMRQRGDFSDALKMYRLAIESDPEYANAHLNLGILLDMYLQELPDALQQYMRYQKLTNNKDKLVAKWIIDIERRIEQDKR